MPRDTDYLLIGSGKLAKHLSAYFDFLQVPYKRWSRSEGKPLRIPENSKLKILIAINDDAIVEFIERNFSGKKNNFTLIHFSGVLSIDEAESVHPLATFGNKTYSLDFYKSIPLITEEGKKPLKDIFAEFPNPNFTIRSNDKSLYHAWCAIGGNFISLIWKVFADRMAEFNIPKNALRPYLSKTLENFMLGNNHLTGPFIRKDMNTIKKHREALINDEFKTIYDDFLKLFFGFE
ncbi:MAG: DUF2520 domain-containing protein [Bacteroidetes bacterium]|nr:DUF2520 domain-containing protein [Bacteroidota bacterium]